MKGGRKPCPHNTNSYGRSHRSVILSGKNKSAIPKDDGLVKSQKMGFPVIPAKAGIQLFQYVLDPGFRRGDAPSDFLRDHQRYYNAKWRGYICQDEFERLFPASLHFLISRNTLAL
jgi:hypothetical protein